MRSSLAAMSESFLRAKAPDKKAPSDRCPNRIRSLSDSCLNFVRSFAGGFFGNTSEICLMLVQNVSDKTSSESLEVKRALCTFVNFHGFGNGDSAFWWNESCDKNCGQSCDVDAEHLPPLCRQAAVQLAMTWRCLAKSPQAYLGVGRPIISCAKSARSPMRGPFARHRFEPSWMDITPALRSPHLAKARRKLSLP
jgi:hypothetical protein